MCLYPRLINNPKYRANKKNGGNIPQMKDKRVNYVPIGCSNCIECRRQKKREWQIRLTEECKKMTNGIFVTLTFSNQSIKAIGIEVKKSGYERDNEIARIAVRRFLERWRKKHKKSVRHWLITELGHQGTENIHLHGIIWTDKPRSDINKIWKYGFTWIGKENDKVSGRAVNYIIKYITKTDINHKNYKPKIFSSKGIGGNYLETDHAKRNIFKGKNTKETYTNNKGYKLALPIYYRNKLYNEEEREQLWLHKLDDNVRWVCGNKVEMDKENAWEHYIRLLEEYRIENKNLGYGSSEINWEERIYERQARNLNYWKRVKDQSYIKKLEEKEKQKYLSKKFR